MLQAQLSLQLLHRIRRLPELNYLICEMCVHNVSLVRSTDDDDDGYS